MADSGPVLTPLGPGRPLTAHEAPVPSLQFRVVEPPAGTLDAPAVNEAMLGGGNTVTVTVAGVVPRLPCS